MAPLRRRNLDRRFVLYPERHRARDKAFLGSGIVPATRDVLIRAGRELDVRPQRDAFELPSAVRLLDLHAGSVVAVCHDHDTGVGAKMQVPELMTGGKRGDEQLRRIPSRRIAAEHRGGRAGYGRFALRADLVRARISAVRRRTGALIAGSVDTNRIAVTLVCHGLLRLAASGCRGRLRYRALEAQPTATSGHRRHLKRLATTSAITR
jgi:hypothetical protein